MQIVILEVNFKSSRISVIRVAQNLGLTLGEIAAALKNLPDQRTPTKRDWERLARNWDSLLDARINQLQRLRDNLSKCIGCGCLSLKKCGLYNREDELAAQGPGPRLMLEEQDK